jgi:hypothetical protein
MKKMIVSCLFAAVLMTVFMDGALAQQKTNDDDHDQEEGHFGRSPGTWDGIVKDGKVNIQFYGKHWSNRRMFDAAELGTLPMDKIGEFNLTREAGRMVFKGVFQGLWGHGTYKFEQNAAFKSYLQQKGYSGFDDELMMSVFFTDINRSYFDFLRENGYAQISNNQFKDLAEQNVSRKVLEDYFSLFKTGGYGHQSIDKMVELREHGVDAKYISSIYALGYKDFSLDKALELRDHGVTASYIAEVRKMTNGNVTLDQAQNLRDHGVSSEYVANLKKMDPNMTLEKAQELRDHGVSIGFINSLQSMGYKNVSLDRAMELVDHGVSANFIKSITELGFKDLSLDKAEELVNHGVNAAFIKKMKGRGLELRTLDDYIRLRDTGFKD